MKRTERASNALEKTREEYQKEVAKLRKVLTKYKKSEEAEKRTTQKLIDEYNIKIEMINVSIFERGRDTRGPIVENQDGVKKYGKRVKKYFEDYMQAYYPTATEETARAFYLEMKDEVEEDYGRNWRNVEPANVDK